MIPGLELAACGPLAVPEEVMAHVVHVESSRNPFAIGVVGGRLLRQPRDLDEAVATVRMLEAEGYNYSIGLAQVNRSHFARFGFDEPAKGFDVCNNLAAGADILAECLQRNGGRWGDAFSCYYSGNPRTGYAHGYVQKVFDAFTASREGAVEGKAIAPAGVVDAVSVYDARITAPRALRAEPLGGDDAMPAIEKGLDPADVGASTRAAAVAETRTGGGVTSAPDVPAAVPLVPSPIPADASTAPLESTPEARLVQAARRALGETSPSPSFPPAADSRPLHPPGPSGLYPKEQVP